MIMEEIWRDIEGYEKLYQVSNLGRVRSLDRVITTKYGVVYPYKGRILKMKKNNSGYSVVSLSKDGKVKDFLIHRLVAKAFIPLEDYNGMEVNHINFDRNDNNVNNLEWITRKENMEYSNNAGHFKGVNAKHSEEEIRVIRKMYKDGLKIPQIILELYNLTSKDDSKEYDRKRLWISKIVNYKIWKHL